MLELQPSQPELIGEFQKAFNECLSLKYELTMEIIGVPLLSSLDVIMSCPWPFLAELDANDVLRSSKFVLCTRNIPPPPFGP